MIEETGLEKDFGPVFFMSLFQLAFVCRNAVEKGWAFVEYYEVGEEIEYSGNQQSYEIADNDIPTEKFCEEQQKYHFYQKPDNGWKVEDDKSLA